MVVASPFRSGVRLWGVPGAGEALWSDTLADCPARPRLKSRSGSVPSRSLVSG